MISLKIRFLKQVFPSSVAAVALFGLVGIASPAKADVTLCPNLATPGGFGGNTTYVVGPLDATCGSDSAVNLEIPAETDYAKLQFNSGMTGYPAGLTLGTLLSLTANVDFSGAAGDNPYYLLAFTDSSDSLGQGGVTDPGGNATDQILLIEFQTSTLSGNTLTVDPNATKFNLYDNSTGHYLEGGQPDTKTIAGWDLAHPSLSGEALQGVWVGEGLASGGSNAESLTVNSLTIATPEPSPVILLLTMLAAVAFVPWKRMARATRTNS